MRIKKINAIREKFKKNIPSIGTWQQIPNGSISEILSNGGYDWVVIDLEHGSFSLNQLPDLFRAIDLGSALPLTRLADSTPKDCKQALDAGSGGVIIPMVETADQLEKIVDSCCWPPNGNRGVGFSRANLFGKYFNEYNNEAQAPIIVAQIESINAVNNLDEILLVKGLDAIIIGPYDLSASLGITAEFENKLFIETLSRITKKCMEYNIPFGDHIVKPDKNLLNERIEKGYRFIAYSIDSVFLTNSSNIEDFRT
ncbi:aldolase/citrate lyase family protein [Candidatus Marinimicrobia bacterium]|nr:aldolase/citrate lyase family protein [Candidatus Neomarinimicrobiota bacterium]